MYEEIHARLRSNALGAAGDTSPATRLSIWGATEQLTVDPEASIELDGALADFVKVITLRAHETELAHIEEVREEGYSDDALFEVTVVAAVAAGMHRLDDALAVLRGSSS